MPANQIPITRQVGQPLPRSIDLVVIHCSATASGKPLTRGEPGAIDFMGPAQIIDAWHAARQFKRSAAAVRAFSPKLPSIGYHYVIDLTGEVWSGRALSEAGAHAAEFNAHSVGICLVGGIEREAKYTAAQWKSLQQVVAMLLVDHGIPCAAPKRVIDKAAKLGYRMFGGVCGHRDLSPDGNGNGMVEPFEWTKTCPGFDVRAWLARGMQPEPGQICEASA
jgi:N-acetyl-anhydromuramyl-L-alanine amidase AmpD